MDHQSFRFYIPGVVFLIPIYIVICWITVMNYKNSDIRVFVLVGGITTLPALALPIGWWIYNSYRVCWIKISRGGYENKDFIKLIKKDTKPFYSPLTNSVLIDLSLIKSIESWMTFDLEIFRKIFYPFTNKNRFRTEIEQKGISLKFTEPLSDIILFKDNTYDYARSISSIRYGIESSVFAIILGSLFAFGLKAIWLFNLGLTKNFEVYIFWIVITIILIISIFSTLLIRWSYADKEYDARLILSTLITFKSNYFKLDSYCIGKIPKEILEKINQLNLTPKSYAAFDLDNTLLIDDIGEAVFATLLKQKYITCFKWADYMALLEQNREEAYRRVINVMAGLTLKKLKKITQEVINSEEDFIEVEGFKIPIPKPNPIMQSIISLLKTKGVDVFVITASNKISAEIICWKYFGIPSINVFGAEFKTNIVGKIGLKSFDIPYGKGKVTVLLNRFKERPLITGGDGTWDKFLLDYTKTNGIRLWLGKDKDEFKEMKNLYYKDLDFLHILK